MAAPSTPALKTARTHMSAAKNGDDAIDCDGGDGNIAPRIASERPPEMAMYPGILPSTPDQLSKNEAVRSVALGITTIDPQYVTQWRSTYDNAQCLDAHYADKGFADQPKGSRTAMARLCMYKDDSDLLSTQHGMLYRWNYSIVGDCIGKAGTIGGEGAAYISEQQRSLDEDDMWPFQKGLSFNMKICIDIDKNRWIDWVYATRSRLPKNGIGLFAAREIQAGTILGYITGEKLAQWTQPSKTPPTEQEEAGQETIAAARRIAKKNHRTSAHVVTIRDRLGFWTTIGCNTGESAPTWVDAPLFLGMCHMNSSQMSTLAGERQYKSHGRLNNVQLMSDGACVTTKRIMPKEELLCSFVLQHNTTSGDASDDIMVVPPPRNKNNRYKSQSRSTSPTAQQDSMPKKKPKIC